MIVGKYCVSAQRGFTKLDLIIVLATTLLAATWIYFHFQRQARVSRLSCTSSLKSVGLAFRMFANDHEDEFPCNVAVEAGGTKEVTGPLMAFMQFRSISNELVSPKPLVCSEDKGRIRATNWANFGNSNLSYFVSLSAKEIHPSMLLIGDRTLSTNRSVLTEHKGVIAKETKLSWATRTHKHKGSIALADGSATLMTDSQVQKQSQLSPITPYTLLFP